MIFSNNKENFQKALDSFFDYCELWKLNVNYSKTNVVIFNSRNNRNFTFNIGGNDIVVTDKYKYLGVIFSISGSFLNMRNTLLNRQIKPCISCFLGQNNLDLPIDLQIKPFDNTVLPILLYACEVWGFENTEIIERVHTEFLRKITKARKSTPKYILYAELGRHPLSIIIKQRMVNFWTRLLTGKTSKLSYKIYQFMLNLNDTEFKCMKWINYEQSILIYSGRYDIWIRQSEKNPPYIGKQIKSNLCDQFLKTWTAELLQSSSKLKNYSVYKNHTNRENYINTLSGPFLLTMFKFRTANHKLPVEVGRWANVELSDRKCLLCQNNQIGDEFHYLLECPFFLNERKQYIDPYYFRRPNILKYSQFLNITNESKLIRLSKFMIIIMKSFAN